MSLLFICLPEHSRELPLVGLAFLPLPLVLRTGDAFSSMAAEDAASSAGSDVLFSTATGTMASTSGSEDKERQEINMKRRINRILEIVLEMYSKNIINILY